MLITDILRLSTRMFRTNKSRTILTILGIGVGIGAILFLVSLGYGLQKLILEKITTSDALLSLDVTTGDLENLKLDDQSLEKIKGINGVDKISPLVSLQAQMNVDDISSELMVNFVNNDYFKLDGAEVKKGAFYNDTPEDKNKIIISSTAMMLFNLDEKSIFEKKITLNLFLPEEEGQAARNSVKLGEDFIVAGIIEDENASYIYLPFENSNVVKNKSYSKIKIRVNTEENLNLVRDSVMEQGYSVSALSDIIEQANQIFKVLQIVLASFGIVALVVSAIGMFNTMTITLLERTQEIGIMKSLGATSGDIWSMFLSEAVMIGFLGGGGGLAMGMVAGEVFNYGVNFLAGAMGGERIDLFYTPLWFTVLIISFSTIVGLITGFYPAKRAAAINCLEALRYK